MILKYSTEAYLLKFLKAAVSSSSPLISNGKGSPLTKVNGFISRKLKSKSAEDIKNQKKKSEQQDSTQLIIT